uniref:Rab3 GTPase-activating protein catalytic subunit n=1 Tax=Culicoides sonorensis TaxID=179676 RepID=A0A336MSV7_CULSO
MLNICMERRRIREGGLPFAMTSPLTSGQTNPEFTDTHDSEEEFFDCNEADEESKQLDSKHSAWNQPTGRLSKLGNMLLVDSDEPLYIPVTQEPVPKTEDQLEDDAEVMLKLGPGSELRAQMMSASLFSDMESFKAANPAGKLEDFIRWYSPRDWIEDESCDEKDPFGRKGKLSPRMLIPGNMWQTTWEQAKPVPARRQRRLFDDTKEAEKVLHFFEAATIGSIIQMTISSLFNAVIEKLQEEVDELKDVIPDWDTNLNKVKQVCCKLSREDWNSPNFKGTAKDKWTSLLNDIINLEYSISQARSLKMKIAPDDIELSEEQKTVLLSLIKTVDTELENGAKNPIAGHILSMFAEAKLAQSEQKYEMLSQSGSSEDGSGNVSGFVLPSPLEKQFTLRVCGKMVNKGIGGPQFLRAIIRNDEFRLCGAFSQDTTFY